MLAYDYFIVKYLQDPVTLGCRMDNFQKKWRAALLSQKGERRKEK
jgi:hypothetical protein